MLIMEYIRILFFISTVNIVHLGWTVAEDEAIITSQKILNDELENDVFDVTTLYQLVGDGLSDVEIHARTNARYIPFNINDTIKGPNINVDSLEYSFRQEAASKSSWHITGWSTGYEYSPLLPELQGEQISGRRRFMKRLCAGTTDGVLTLTIGPYYNGQNLIQIYYKEDGHDYDYIYTQPAIEIAPTEYYKGFTRNSMDLKICVGLYEDRYYSSDQNCRILHSFNNTHEYLHLVIDRNNELITVQEVDSSAITVSTKTFTFSSLLLEIDENERPEKLFLNYIDATRYPSDVYASFSVAHVGYINKTQPNFIEKDWFVPVNDKVCFSIVNKVVDAVLIVSAIYNNDQRIHLANISSEHTTKWNIATVIFPYLSLTDLKKYELKLRIEASLDKSSNAIAFVDQIYACDPNGIEDVYITKDSRESDNVSSYLKKLKEGISEITKTTPESTTTSNINEEQDAYPVTDFATPTIPIDPISSYIPYNITISIKDNLFLKDNAICKNGGVQYNQKCACPPGFRGVSCEQGCGANSYGMDCEGTCTRHSNNNGCMGIALCTPYTGCNCAPGFFGNSCSLICERGRYGNGCEQKCEHCIFGDCDRFTGYCRSACEDGYTFPHCNELYKHIYEKPRVVNISYTEAVIQVPFDKLAGVGDPVFYEILYRVVDSEELWIPYLRRRMPLGNESVIVNIRNLTVGVMYEIKVHLIHNDGKYVSDVPALALQTMCDELYPWIYNLNVKDITEHSFIAQWTENNPSSRDCKLKKYEVYIQDGWKWVNVGNVTEPRFRYDDGTYKLIPGYSYNIKMRPLTYYTALPFSNIVKIDIPINDVSNGSQIDLVRSLEYNYKNKIEILSIIQNSRNISITWNHCSELRYSWTDYYIYYRLENYFSCEPQTYGSESLMMSPPAPVNDAHNTYKTIRVSYLQPTSKVITGLKPNANYSIAVTNIHPRVGITGQDVDFYYAVTLEDVPEIPPSIVDSETSITNGSAIFLIDNRNENDHCTLLNGNVLSFYVQLFENDETLTKRFETSDPRLEFREIESDTTYYLEICYINSAGMNLSACRKINFTTKRSYPIPVTSLTVYKRSNRILGIRWIADKFTGNGRKFLIKYSHNGEQVKNVSDGTRCTAWPEMYCFTVDHLTPRASYTLQVSVANDDYPEGGIAASVTNETSEGLPEEPSSLEVVNVTNSEVTIEWTNPNIFNGILRSFVINVEEIEAVDMSLCCNTLPSIDYPVLQENIKYNTTVKNLTPGSTYKIGIAAKTTWFGRDKTITVTIPDINNNHVL